MIRRTFQLLPSVGPWRERDLWARGIESWDDFPAEGSGVGISKRIDRVARARIRECRAALAKRDLAELARLLPPREHWRLYADFTQDFVTFAEKALNAGKTVDQAAAEYKLPSKFKGYILSANPQWGGVTENLKIAYDELKKKK